MALERALGSLALLALVIPVLSFMWFWFLLLVPFLCSGGLFLYSASPEELRVGTHPAPDWFVSALKTLPRHELNATELEQLNVDGVVLARGLVADDKVLAELRRAFHTKEQTVGSGSWRINGLMNAMVRHSPVPAIASSSLGGKPVALWNAQVEPRPARSSRTTPYPDRPWMDAVGNPEGYSGRATSMSIHDDVGHFPGLHSDGYPTIPMSSIFVALTDIPLGLHFIAGSHLLNKKHQCPHGPFGVALQPGCFDALWNESLGERAWDMKAGDAVVFWGATYHWTVLTKHARQALSIRYLPADMKFTGKVPFYEFAFGDSLPPACGPIGDVPTSPVMYPPPAPAPGLDPATGSQPGRPWPVVPRCPRRFDVSSMLRWIHVAIRFSKPPEECGVVGQVGTGHLGLFGI